MDQRLDGNKSAEDRNTGIESDKDSAESRYIYVPGETLFRNVYIDPRGIDIALTSKFLVYIITEENDKAKTLLENPRVDPATQENAAIFFAVTHRNKEMVEMLLAHPRVDPAAQKNAAIRHAVTDMNKGMVEMLLAHPRVDPTYGNNRTIRMAAQKGDREIIKMLLKHPMVKANAEAKQILEQAIAGRR